MEYRTLIPADVTALFRDLKLTRGCVNRLLTFLHVEMPAQAANLRGNRNPDDERQFLCRCDLLDVDGWHELQFAVDDVTAPGRLWVVSFTHKRRPFM